MIMPCKAYFPELLHLPGVPGYCGSGEQTSWDGIQSFLDSSTIFITMNSQFWLMGVIFHACQFYVQYPPTSHVLLILFYLDSPKYMIQPSAKVNSQKGVSIGWAKHSGVGQAFGPWWSYSKLWVLYYRYMSTPSLIIETRSRSVQNPIICQYVKFQKLNRMNSTCLGLSGLLRWQYAKYLAGWQRSYDPETRWGWDVWSHRFRFSQCGHPTSPNAVQFPKVVGDLCMQDMTTSNSSAIP